MLTIEGNNEATDGSFSFTVTIGEGDDFLLGGSVNGTEYYTSVQVTIEEDDGMHRSIL